MAKDRGDYTATYRVMMLTAEWEALSLEGSAVLNALRMWPEGNRVGIFPIFREELAHYSKVPLERIQGALRELEAAKWILMEGRWVWIRNALRFDPNYAKTNEKARAGVVAVLKGLPRMSLVQQFIAYYVALDYLAEGTVLEGAPIPYRSGIEAAPDGLPSGSDTPSIPVAVSVAVAVTPSVAIAVADSQTVAVTSEPSSDQATDEPPPTTATPAEARAKALDRLGPKDCTHPAVVARQPIRRTTVCPDCGEEIRPAEKPNPFLAERGRDAWELEALALTRDIGALRLERQRAGDHLADDEPVDGTEIFALAAHYEGAAPGRTKCNPANLRDDRLVNTVLDLRATLKAEQAKRRSA